MATTAKPPNGKKSPEQLPTANDLVAFDHAAAGHEGISSNPSGSLVIKPCTPAEISFYESAKHHPHFQAHMPTFMGSLALNQDSNAIAPLLAQAREVVSVHKPKRSSISTLPHLSELMSPVSRASSSHHLAADSVVSPISSKRASWKPSGGKKLETGLAIVLENVTVGFKHPNILDVKLGARLWADDAPASKRKKLDDTSKATTSSSLGFRIAGMKIWHEEGKNVHGSNLTPEENIEIKDGHKIYGKLYGQNLTAETAHQGFAAYFGGVDSPSPGERPTFNHVLRRKVAQRILRELESVQFVLEHEESRMYSASILMVYEGDDGALQATLRDEEMYETAMAENQLRQTVEKKEGAEIDNEVEEVLKGGADEDEEEAESEEGDEDEDEDISPKVHDVRLIDFAHASWTPGQGPDENALQGVRSVIKIIRGFLGGGGGDDDGS